VAEEGNNLDDYQRLSQLFSPGIFWTNWLLPVIGSKHRASFWN
jgi:hypothetical protein